MFRSALRKEREDSKTLRKSGRLPLRWGLILLASSIAAVAVGAVAGLPIAIGTWVAVAVGLDQLLD